jgi:hypothetical protein
MSNVFNGEKSISDLDQYYGISDQSVKKTGFYDTKLKESKKIQSAFNNHCVHLTLRECGDMYEAWSDERYCAGWEGGLEEMTEEEIFSELLEFFKALSDENRLKIIGLLAQQPYM